MTELDIMKDSAESIINQFDKDLTGLKRRNSLLEMARIFKSYEIRCVRLANIDA